MTFLKSIAGALALTISATFAQADTAQINGAEIYFESIGDGPPVLMMHGGLGLSHDYLRPYFDQLAETHTVVYYDHFGNGRSAKPDDYAEMTFDRLTSDAAALMDELGHETFVLIGHSYGGFVAQAFATQHADRLTGLVLIDTVPAFDYPPALSGTEEQMAALGKIFSEPMTSDAEWRDTWGLVIQMYFKEWDADLGAEIDARTQYEHRAWNAGGALLGTFNMLEALPQIDVPTLAMAGAADGITPPGPGAERIASLVPGAKLMIFEDAAHYPFIETPEAFFAGLKGWLADL